MRYLFDLVYLVAFLPLIFFSKSRRELWDRIRRRRSAVDLRGNGFRVWFHGVSVGEVHLLRGVVARFRARHPHIQCVISSTTATGLEEARKSFPHLTVIEWPVDFSWVVARALREIRPDLVVTAEGEYWPNFLLAAKRHGIPVVAINVRFSPRSVRRYRRLRKAARGWLGLVDYFAVQTDSFADLLKDMGIDSQRVTVTGSVKYEGANMAHPRTAEFRQLFDIKPDDVVWVAGSTQEPEEQIVLDIYRRLSSRYPNLRLIIVPRQRDRFDAVAELIRRSGAPLRRRSELAPVAALPSRLHEVVLVDTMGELAAVWGLADIAFVGGSLDGRRGGQNMIEPAACGAAVIFGPHTWNFRDTVERMLEADAAREIRDGAELESELIALIEDPERRSRLGKAARTLVKAQQGATERTLDAIEQFLPQRVRTRTA